MTLCEPYVRSETHSIVSLLTCLRVVAVRCRLRTLCRRAGFEDRQTSRTTRSAVRLASLTRRVVCRYAYAYRSSVWSQG